MAPKDVQRAAWRLAKRQYWVITRRQLIALGYTSDAIEHRIETGRLFSMWPGVYAVGRRELSRDGRFVAAVLACGPGAALSHMSAAVYLGICRRDIEAIEISVPAGRNPRRRGIKVHRRANMATGLRRNIPVTTPTQTLLDVASRMSTEQYERTVNEAVNRDLVDPETLRATLDKLGARPGVRRLRTLLDRDTYVVTDTELEQRVVPIARRAGLGEIRAQASLNGRRVDFFFPEHDIVVEANSLRFHRTASQQANDARRAQEHASAGLLPIPFTHWQITYDPKYVEQTLRAAVDSRTSRSSIQRPHSKLTRRKP